MKTSNQMCFQFECNKIDTDGFNTDDDDDDAVQDLRVKWHRTC